MDRYTTAVPFAEGATSEVFRAAERDSGRVVAIKVLRGSDPELKRRFRVEADALARLDHPRIARLIEHGEIDGRPFLAMEFVDGVPFDRALAGQAPEVVVRAFLKIVDALAHVHDLGLLHRDLKPANILVRQAEGGDFEPVLVDFGLARDLAAPTETATGALLGTPAFMAPEQARGDREAIGRATDIYGLGAVLYAALTGRPPHTADSAGDVIAAVLSEPPPRPGGAVPVALEAILGRALARRPERRYSSARRLAADLESWLDGHSVGAMRGFRWRLARQAMMRRKWLTAGTAAALLAIAALGLQQAWLHQRAAEKRQLAVQLADELAETRGRLQLLHLAPPHDIRGKWSFIERALETLTAHAQDPDTRNLPGVHYARGRLLLDAGRPAEALPALQRARVLGCRSAGCASALAMAHMRLHQRDLERQLESMRDDTVERPTDHLAAARRALAGIRAAGVEGAMLAAMAGAPDRAAALGERALVSQPWAYVIPRAVGDARYRAGLEAMRSDDLAIAVDHFERAAADFRRAVDIARSDPDGYLGICRSLARATEVAMLDRELVLDWGEAAMERCREAHRIDSGREEAYTIPAGILEQMARSAYEAGRSEAAAARIRNALKLLDSVPAGLEASAVFLEMRARVLSTVPRAKGLVGRPAVEWMRRGLEAARRATELAPDSRTAWSTWVQLVRQLIAADPEATGLSVEALEVARIMAERWPEDRSVRRALGSMLVDQAYHRRLSGQPDEVLLRRAIEILEQLAADAPGYTYALTSLGLAWWEMVFIDHASGRDPTASEERARAAFLRVLADNPSQPTALINLSGLNLTVAELRLKRGQPAGQRARRSLDLLKRVRRQGEYLPCDIALAHWFVARSTEQEIKKNDHRALALQHADLGTTEDCRRVETALGGRMVSNEKR